MKTSFCDACGSLVFFENFKCLGCGHGLGFLPDILDMSALEPAAPDTWHALAAGHKDEEFRSCENGRSHQICNWLASTNCNDVFCEACRLNRTVPDLRVAGNRERWLKMERAKRRLIYTLLSLKLPLDGWNGRPALRFDFLADVPGSTPILTGHEKG